MLIRRRVAARIERATRGIAEVPRGIAPPSRALEGRRKQIQRFSRVRESRFAIIRCEPHPATRDLHHMDESDFEGTLVLEQLAAIGRVDEFFDAVDADDIERAKSLMKKAQIDATTMAMVVKKMEESDGEH
jgi:hypothetical protein